MVNCPVCRAKAEKSKRYAAIHSERLEFIRKNNIKQGQVWQQRLYTYEIRTIMPSGRLKLAFKSKVHRDRIFTRFEEPTKLLENYGRITDPVDIEGFRRYLYG